MSSEPIAAASLEQVDYAKKAGLLNKSSSTVTRWGGEKGQAKTEACGQAGRRSGGDHFKLRDV